MFIDFHSHNFPVEHPALVVLNAANEKAKNIDFYYCAGIHPWSVNNYAGNLERQMAPYYNDKHFVALGECGLDKIKKDTWQRQVELFYEHINYAREKDIPCLILHCVKAYQEILKIIDDYHYKGTLVFHDYNGDLRTTKQLLKRDVYLSYGDKLFRPDSRGHKSLAIIPLDRIFLETDKGLRGQIFEIYQQAAICLNLSVVELEQQITDNWKTLFPNHPIKYRGRGHA